MPEPIFHLPPYTVEALVFTTLAETVDWGQKMLGVPDQWAKSKGKGVRVAVLDTGVDQAHYQTGDLKDAVIAAQDFSRSRFSWYDVAGHGTHTAGTVGARNNNKGVVGNAPECQLLIGKVLGDNGSGSSGGIAQGIDWSRAQKAHVISMSLGSSQPDEQIHKAIQRAVAAGIYVICAAGNEGPGLGDTVGWPARFEESVAVGATDERGDVADFSSRGPEVNVCAPGQNILSTYLNGGYAKLSGTSMATPFVTGIVALMIGNALEEGIQLPDPEALKQHLIDSTTAWQPGEGDGSGSGIIDPEKVIGLDKPKPPVDGQKPSLDLGFAKIYIPARAGDLCSFGV